jgi:hypothetical protein
VVEPLLESHEKLGQSSFSRPILHHFAQTLVPPRPRAQTRPALQSAVDLQAFPSETAPATTQFVVPWTPSDETRQVVDGRHAPKEASAAELVGSSGLHCCVQTLYPAKGWFEVASST